jgi:DNA modification methylase
MKELWVGAFKNAIEVTRSGGCYYICSPQGGELMMMMMMSILEAGWELKHCLIWVKNNIVLGRSDYNYQHEPLLYGWKEGKHNFYGEGGASSVWQIDKPRSSKLHPTMKPVELCARAIKNSSKPNEIVLDLFGGSGSTLIACEQLDRICYMMELDCRYVDVIRKRYANYKEKNG